MFKTHVEASEIISRNYQLLKGIQEELCHSEDFIAVHFYGDNLIDNRKLKYKEQYKQYNHSLQIMRKNNYYMRIANFHEVIGKNKTNRELDFTEQYYLIIDDKREILYATERFDKSNKLIQGCPLIYKVKVNDGSEIPLDYFPNIFFNEYLENISRYAKGLKTPCFKVYFKNTAEGG